MNSQKKGWMMRIVKTARVVVVSASTMQREIGPRRASVELDFEDGNLRLEVPAGSEMLADMFTNGPRREYRVTIEDEGNDRLPTLEAEAIRSKLIAELARERDEAKKERDQWMRERDAATSVNNAQAASQFFSERPPRCLCCGLRMVLGPPPTNPIDATCNDCLRRSLVSRPTLWAAEKADLREQHEKELLALQTAHTAEIRVLEKRNAAIREECSTAKLEAIAARREQHEALRRLSVLQGTTVTP